MIFPYKLNFLSRGSNVGVTLFLKIVGRGILRDKEIMNFLFARLQKDALEAKNEERKVQYQRCVFILIHLLSVK